MDALRPSAGLTPTVNALQRSQGRLDAAVLAQVEAVQGADPATGDAAPAGDLVLNTANLVQERLMNQILAGVFRAQVDQQQEALRLPPPPPER